MQTSTESPDETLRRPLERALFDELLRLERFCLVGWQLVGVGGIAIGIGVAASVAPALGLLGAVVAALFLLYFRLIARRLSRGPLDRRWTLALAVGEAAVPWSFAAVIVATEGPRYALSSWLPPSLFFLIIIIAVARLQPRMAMVHGVIGAVAWLLIYGAIRSRLGAIGGEVVLSLPMQISRASSLLAGGIGAFFAGRELRRAIGRADALVREQELFGKYRLGKLVAAGGMGAVHDALYCPEGGFQRRVAVKLLHPHLAMNPAFVAGFRAEAELGARLSHPNVVTIFDFGRQRGAYFLAMEFVDGTTLARVLARLRARNGKLSTAVVGYVGRAVLAGLDHAHRGARDEQGEPLRIVHRDMCPQNVLVSRAGEVKISDFGIARALRQAESAYTRTAAGHEAYMAPEQLRVEPLDPRADLFAVGVMIWEMLAGRRLFACANEAATISAVLGQPVMPPSVVRPELGPDWDAFIAQALERDREQRFWSATEMSAALARCLGEGDRNGRDELVTILASLEHEPEPPELEASDTDTMHSEPTRSR